MPLQRRLLQPLYSRVLTSPATRRAWRSMQDWLGRISRRPLRLTVWLRLDDPQCALLAQMLPQLLDHYPLELDLRVLPPLSEHDPHATIDAWHLAQFYQLRFHSLTPPAPEDCWLGCRILLATANLPQEERLVLLRQLFACVWEHQHSKLATLALRFPPEDEESALERMAAEQEECSRTPGVASGALAFGNEYFQGLDDLPELVSRLEAANLNRLEHTPGVGPAVFPDTGFLITDSEMLATVRAQRYRLDFYFCFCDPYSYLNLEGLFALADHYSLRLRLLPVTIPRTGRVAARPLPPAGLLWQSARHASLRQREFGDVCLPDAAGLRYCHALMAHAERLGRDREMAESLLASIWARGRDLSYRPHLLAALREAGFDKTDPDNVLTSLPANIVERHGPAWQSLELPSLPGLVLNSGAGIALCGADRLWALDMALADTLNK